MLTPPLFIRLTDCADGEKKNFLLTNIHMFQAHSCDDLDCDIGSEIATLLPVCNPLTGQPLMHHTFVMESAETIEQKMRKVMRNYARIAYGNAYAPGEDWRGNDDDDDDEEPTLWA